uniref:Uncharacterized protein n=1 Tax=Zea mays TaxID=4577 RepID=A0A804RD23_MAIZE
MRQHEAPQQRELGPPVAGRPQLGVLQPRRGVHHLDAMEAAVVEPVLGGPEQEPVAVGAAAGPLRRRRDQQHPRAAARVAGREPRVLVQPPPPLGVPPRHPRLQPVGRRRPRGAAVVVVPRGRRRAGRRRRLVVVGASVRVVVGVCAYLAEDALDVLDGSGAARGRGRVRAVVGAAGDVDEAAVDADGAAEDEERDEGAEERVILTLLMIRLVSLLLLLPRGCSRHPPAAGVRIRSLSRRCGERFWGASRVGGAEQART